MKAVVRYLFIIIFPTDVFILDLSLDLIRNGRNKFSTIVILLAAPSSVGCGFDVDPSHNCSSRYLRNILAVNKEGG